MYTTNLKKGFISFLLGVIVFSLFSFSSPVSASIAPTLGPVTSVTSDGADQVTVSMSVYAAPVSTLDVLKASITLQRTGEEAYSALATNDTIAFSSTDTTATLVVTFAEALSGNTNSLHIAGDALMNLNHELYSELTIAMDVAAPSYAGSRTGNNGGYVDLYFDENFSLNYETNLRDNISVATDGVNFVALSEQSEVEYYNAVINIEYYNDMQIILGSNTRIKIASGTIMDAAGNLNDEMILEVTPPIIQNVEISEDNHDVTVTYNEDIYDNTSGTLKTLIWLVKDDDWIAIGANDSVSINGKELIIHFANSLSGTNNQIFVDRNSVRDTFGNILNEYRITAVFQANELDPVPNPDVVDITAPKYIESYYTNSFNTVNFVFDEGVEIDEADEAIFRANIQWYHSTTGWNYGLPQTAIVTTIGNIVSIDFMEYTGNYRYVSIQTTAARLIGDIAGNKISNNSFTSAWLDNSLIGSTTFTMYNDSNFSHNGRKLSLNFGVYNYSLVDRTIIDGVSHLKEAITISVEGSPFSALEEGDIVSIQGNSIIIFFEDAITVGSVQVRITENVVSDKYDYQRNSAVNQAVNYNTPDITGYMFSNAASEFVFSDYATWSSGVSDIYIEDDNIGTKVQIADTEYTFIAGKLTFNSGLFQEGHYYIITVNAEGYSSKEFEGTAYKSSEIFYMTAPVMTEENGITASINLFNRADYDYYSPKGTQTVIFQLMNGSTPVSIVASSLRVDTGTYTANFNVKDATTNPDYTVRAFVVSKYNNDPASVGFNLATVKTQSELDQLIMLGNDRNNNDRDFE